MIESKNTVLLHKTQSILNKGKLTRLPKENTSVTRDSVSGVTLNSTPGLP